MKVDDLKTEDLLHNLHFQKTTYYSEPWASRSMLTRSISFDNPCTNTWFTMDRKNFNLYCEFDSDRGDERIFYIGRLSRRYTEALLQLVYLETFIWKILVELDTASIHKLNESQLRQLIGLDKNL